MGTQQNILSVMNLIILEKYSQICSSIFVRNLKSVHVLNGPDSLLTPGLISRFGPYCAISSSLLTLESFSVSIDIALELLLGVFPRLFDAENEGQVTVDIPDLSAKLLKDAKSVAYSNSVFTIHSRLHRKC